MCAKTRLSFAAARPFVVRCLRSVRKLTWRAVAWLRKFLAPPEH